MARATWNAWKERQFSTHRYPSVSTSNAELAGDCVGLTASLSKLLRRCLVGDPDRRSNEYDTCNARPFRTIRASHR
jgi:hypothetical protein